MSNEYFERFQAVRRVVEADEALLRRLDGVFAHQYQHERLPDVVIPLGNGVTHSVFSVGAITFQDEKLFLALKLNNRHSYMARLDAGLINLLGGYEYRFFRGDNPPNFVGAVVLNRTIGNESGLAGVLMEDLSKGNTLELIEETDNSFCTVVKEDGTREERFLDHEFGDISEGGEKYVKKEAMLYLPEF